MKKSSVRIGFQAIALAGVDQLLKWLAATYLATPFILTPWASLRYEQNYGIAWSIPVPQPWLTYLNILLLIMLPFFIAQHVDLRRKISQILLSFIVGGAIGNLTDRLIHGYVIDYISVGWFPVFNFADALLTVGIFLLLLFYAKIKRTKA